MKYLLGRAWLQLQVTTEPDCESVDFQMTLYIELSAPHQIYPRKQDLPTKNISQEQCKH